MDVVVEAAWALLVPVAAGAFGAALDAGAFGVVAGVLLDELGVLDEELGVLDELEGVASFSAFFSWPGAFSLPFFLRSGVPSTELVESSP